MRGKKRKEDETGSKRKIKRKNKACANCGSDELTDGEVTGEKADLQVFGNLWQFCRSHGKQ